MFLLSIDNNSLLMISPLQIRSNTQNTAWNSVVQINLQLSVNNMLKDSLQLHPEFESFQIHLHLDPPTIQSRLLQTKSLGSHWSWMTLVQWLVCYQKTQMPQVESHDHGNSFPNNAAEIPGTSRIITTTRSQKRQAGIRSHSVQGQYGSANSEMPKLMLFKSTRSVAIWYISHRKLMQIVIRKYKSSHKVMQIFSLFN